jgi:hypothetical protein
MYSYTYTYSISFCAMNLMLPAHMSNFVEIAYTTYIVEQARLTKHVYHVSFNICSKNLDRLNMKI